MVGRTRVSKFMPNDLLIWGELWKPYDPNDWESKQDMGNFTKVINPKLPKFQRMHDCDNESINVVVFPSDIICKLHRGLICKQLHPTQYANWYRPYGAGEGNQIYYYGMNNLPEWKTKGGCVHVPKCLMQGCEEFGCDKHLKYNIDKRPTEMKTRHVCGFDDVDKICLLSSFQMIVQSWLKTNSVNQLHSVFNEKKTIQKLIENFDKVSTK